MSIIPTRLETWESPSQISRTPAIAPSSVERVSRRAMRITSSTHSVPASAETTRQPTGSYPKTHCPSAMSCLDSGGWTTSS